MKKLIEDYKKRLSAIVPLTDMDDEINKMRLVTKAEYYSTFIAELERIQTANEPCKGLGYATCKHFEDQEMGCFDCTKHYMQIK